MNPSPYKNRDLLTPGRPRPVNQQEARKEAIRCGAIVAFLLLFLILFPG